jgi:hypothetical protein
MYVSGLNSINSEKMPEIIRNHEMTVTGVGLTVGWFM